MCNAYVDNVIHMTIKDFDGELIVHSNNGNC